MRPRRSRWGLFAFAAAALGAVPGAVRQEPSGPSTASGLSIDGTAIPVSELRRAVCLGHLRERWLDVYVLEVCAEAERERRRAEGRPGAPDEPCRFLEERPFDFELGEVLSWSGIEFVHTLRELFVPEDPSEYPPLTLALEEDPRGSRMLQQARMVFEARSSEPGAGPSEGEAHLRDLLLQHVLVSLRANATIVEEPGRLSDGVLLEVNGRALETDRLWPLVAGLAAPRELDRAKRWLVHTRVLEAAFREAGTFPDEDWVRGERARLLEANPTPEELREAYGVLGFPSFEHWLTYRRLVVAMHAELRAGLTQEVLERSLRERLAPIEGSTVDVDLLLVSAYDFKEAAWKPDGWTRAESRLQHVLAELTKGERSWEELLAEHSEFPPSVGLGRRRQRGPRASRGEAPGTLRNHTHMALMTTLEENAYTRFVNGGTVTDVVFFELPEGELGAPLRGEWGWMIPLLHRRTPPAKRLLKSGPESLKNVGTYVVREMVGFLRKEVARRDVRGL